MSTISFFGTLVDTLMQHYELHEILDITVLPSVRSHATSPDSVYHVITRAGSYVLRPFRSEAIAAIDLHNQFLLWSEKSAWPLTQRIVQTRQRENFFEADQRKWWLSSYIEADYVFDWTKPAWSAESCRQSGRALFLLHEALRSFGGENADVASTPPPASTPTSSNNSRETRSPVWSDLEKQLSDSSLRAQGFSDQVNQVLPLVSNAVAQVEKSDLSTLQLIHGDFHPGNVLFGAQDVVAIIDFEYLTVASPIYDLAYALVMFCCAWGSDGRSDRSKSNREGGSDHDILTDDCADLIDGQLNPEYLQSFINGYSTDTCNLQLQLLAPYITIAAAICLTWFLQRELDDRTVEHFINVLKQSENFSTMDLFAT